MKRFWAPQAIVAVMLLWASYTENPYGHHILLRYVCCAVFLYLATQALSQGTVEVDAWRNCRNL